MSGFSQVPPRISCFILSLTMALIAAGQSGTPEIVSISPTSGPEGTHAEIAGRNFQGASAVLFGATTSTFKLLSSQKLIALVPRRVTTSVITVITPSGRATSPFVFAVCNDPRVPDDVGWRAGYVNPLPPPRDFNSVLLWGIAIADTRVRDHESAEVEVAWSQLSCRVDGKEVVLNNDSGNVRGGLYLRQPWFGGDDYNEPMPLAHDPPNRAVVLRVGRRTDRVWHFWSASSRARLPSGKLEGCTVKARVKISPGALVQMGMDYWRSPTARWEGSSVNNHEAGASNWYFSSPQWQEASFTDVGGPQF
jgi:hypothetical protein